VRCVLHRQYQAQRMLMVQNAPHDLTPHRKSPPSAWGRKAEPSRYHPTSPPPRGGGPLRVRPSRDIPWSCYGDFRPVLLAVGRLSSGNSRAMFEKARGAGSHHPGSLQPGFFSTLPYQRLSRELGLSSIFVYWITYRFTRNMSRKRRPAKMWEVPDAEKRNNPE